MSTFQFVHSGPFLRVFAVALALALLSGCATTRCPMCGHWKSDEARTLGAMREAQARGEATLTRTQIDTYTRNYFGRLHTQCDAERCRVWRPEEDPEASPWFAYRLTRDESRAWMIDLPEIDVPARRISMDDVGDCYEIEMSDVGFGEWFCRVEPRERR